MANDWTNLLYYGDNLEILREYVSDNSVALIYLDPPFNSKANYNVLFPERSGEKSRAQITAFEDTWHWGLEAEQEYHELVEQGPHNVARFMGAMRKFLGTNDMMAYLCMMGIRLVELQRVLKPSGTLYLHCDPTASHYIKLLMDAVFGAKYFRNEIVWCYRGGGRPKQDFARKHDIILRYSKNEDVFFNPDPIRIPYQAEGKGRTDDSMWGRHGSDKVYRPHPKGKVPEDWWPINPLNANDPNRLGYPTQKPEELLERIILSSSRKGETVLDPFCGCGTAVAVAERYDRHWIGIDITHIATNLIKYRLADTFGDELTPYEIIGEPRDIRGARTLAEQDRFQFEYWALGLVEARPSKSEQTRGADAGIDGVLHFFDDTSNEPKEIILQVKSGQNIAVGDLRDLVGTVENEGAVMGAYLTLYPPKRGMSEYAASQGFYYSEILDIKYPKIQILTIKGLLDGTERLKYPRIRNATFWEGKRSIKDQGEQGNVFESS